MHVQRFFRNELPQLNELVIVRVTREEEEFGYYCDLLEYEKLEGFLPLSELVKKKYAKKHLLKPGQILAMTINKVEQVTRLVNLTRKRVTDEEDTKKKESYRICEDINKLINEYYIMYLSSLCPDQEKKLNINKFMNKTIWTLYDAINNDYTKAYQYILQDPGCLLPEFIFERSYIDHVLDDVGKRITFTNKVISLDIKLLVPAENPISKIKEILDISTIQVSNYKLKVLVMTSPYYRIQVEGLFSDDSILKITNVIKDKIIENSKKYYCILEFSEPKIEKESIYKIKYYSDRDLLTL